MKNNKIQDERVILQKRKIASDAFGILFYGLLISVLIQQFVFEVPFSQYAVEWILFTVTAFYVVVRNITVGNNLFSNMSQGQKPVIINSIVCGTTIAIITTTLNTVRVDKMGKFTDIVITALITFICGGVISFIGFETLYQINKKRQKQIDDMYKDDDE